MGIWMRVAQPASPHFPALIGRTVIYPATYEAGFSLTSRAGHGGHVIAALRGELGIASAPALREQLIGLLRPDASRLIIDLSAVSYADASGLAVLVGTGHRTALLGGFLRLAAPSAEVAQVLSATGMNRHLDIFATVQAAIRQSSHTYQIQNAVARYADYVCGFPVHLRVPVN